MSNISRIIRGAAAAGIPGMVLVAKDTNEYTTNSTTAVDLVTLDGFSIDPEVPILLCFSARKTAGATAIFGLGLTLNATVTGEAWTASSSGGLSGSGYSDRVEIAGACIYLPPRVTGYLGGVRHQVQWAQVQSMTAGVTGHAVPYWSDEPPTVPITEITIRGMSGNASVTGAVKNVFIYTLPTEVG